MEIISKIYLSTSAAYAVVGYQTAYLMKYYPAEFTAAMLNSIMDSAEKVAYYTRFAESMNIQVLPPDINESYSRFTVKGNTIRFGLAAVKNVGINVIESIVRARDTKGRFKDFSDFANKLDFSSVNKRAVESLIKSGALDCFGVYRSKLLAIYEKVLDGINNDRKRNIEGQISLFGDLTQSVEGIDIKYPDIKEFDKKYILAMEKEMTGLYLSGHPLDEHEETLNLQTNTKISDIIVNESLEEIDVVEEIFKIKDGDRVIIGGIMSEVSKKITKNNEMMAFLRLQDLYGSVEVIVFPKTFDKYRNLIDEDALVIIKGRVSIREEEQPKILCEDIQPLIKINSEKVYILIEEEKIKNKVLGEIRSELLQYKGNTPVYLCTRKERKKFMLDRDLWINTEIDVMNYLRNKFGEENVKIM